MVSSTKRTSWADIHDDDNLPSVTQTRDGANAQTVEGQSTQPSASVQPFPSQGSMLGQPELGQSEPGQIGPEQSAEPVGMQSVAPSQMLPSGQALIEQNEELVAQQYADEIPELDPLDLQERYRDIKLGRRSFSCPANCKDHDPVLLEGGRKFKELRSVVGAAPAASPAQPAQTSSAAQPQPNRESGSTRARARASSARPIYKGYCDPRPARPMPKKKSGPSKWQPLYDDGTAVYPLPGTPGGPVSLGTHAHYVLACTPCQFWYINRCRKGADCQYCHIKHTKFDYKRIRESKWTRDRRKYYEWYYGSRSSVSQSQSSNSRG